MRLSSIHIYPVKSTRAVTLSEAVVEPWGLAGDRRWMAVDGGGAPLTARTDSRLLAITATPDVQGGLALVAAGHDTLSVEVPRSGERVSLRLSRLDFALSAGAVADAWLSEVLGRRARLVWLDDPTRRAVGAHHGGRDAETMTLSDAGPLLLTTTSSLRRLHAWILATAAALGEAEPIPCAMSRFRPNVVVEGDLEPFAEDRWVTLQIGGIAFRTLEVCDRCEVVTIDPLTLDRAKEPLRTLARHRRWDGAVWFGTRLVPLHAGTITVGDLVVAE